MRLGIISDTHGTLPNEVFDVFAEVDLILHAGDVGEVDILTALEAICPVKGVYGNTDGWDIRNRYPRFLHDELDGLYFTVAHGDHLGTPSPRALVSAFPDADVIVFGHTHKPVLELVNKTVTVMNPGSAAFPRGGGPPSVGIMELEPGLPPRGRLVPLE